MSMRPIALTIALVSFAAAATAMAQSGPPLRSAEPFKLGTFLIGGRPTVGVVLRDSLVVDLVPRPGGRFVSPSR